MATKLSNSQRRRVDRVIETLRSIQVVGVKLRSEDDLSELFRRGAVAPQPDGYPSRSMGDFTSSGGQSEHTPTEAAVLARERPLYDDVGTAIRTIEDNVQAAESLLYEASNALFRILAIQNEMQGRLFSTPCSICLIAPAQKAGWCFEDFNEWWRHGRPDRLRWEMFVRQDRTPEGELRVPVCPPPTTHASKGPWANGATPDLTGMIDSGTESVDPVAPKMRAAM